MKNCGKGKERSAEASQMKRARGSFTVEASLLMTIIIPVLVSLIYGSFYLHDCAVMQGAACELAAMASNLQGDPNRESLLQKKKEELLQGRLLGTRQGTISLTVSDSKVQVSCEGKFYIPGLVSHLLSQNLVSIEKSWNRKLYHPTETIRKIRGIKALADTAKG